MFILQLNVEACDDNVPQRCDSATAYVTVIRQEVPPVFQDTPYTVEISEFRPTQSSIYRVNALDGDQVSHIHRMMSLCKAYRNLVDT